MADNSGKNRRKMPKGKPFEKGDPRINRKGAPPRGQSWAETIKRLTDMTREEAIEYVGAGTKLGGMLRELPPEVTIKDAMILAVIIAFGREPNARMLQALMDRAEGKAQERVDITSKDEKIAFDYGRFINSATRPVQDRDASSQDESNLHGSAVGQNDDVRRSGS